MSVANDPQADDRPINRDLRRLSLIAWFAAIFGSALVVGSIALVTAASGQERSGYSLEIFYGPRGSRTMRGGVSVGPFADISRCYAAGALVVDDMQTNHTDRDFMARCDGGILLTGRELADRALAPGAAR